MAILRTGQVGTGQVRTGQVGAGQVWTGCVSTAERYFPAKNVLLPKMPYFCNLPFLAMEGGCEISILLLDF